MEGYAIMEPTTTIIGGVLVAVISGAIGKYAGSNGRVKNEQCGERREACTNLLIEKIDNLTITVDGLKTDISNLKTI